MGREYLPSYHVRQVPTTPPIVMFRDRFIGPLQWTGWGQPAGWLVDITTDHYFTDIPRVNQTSSLRLRTDTGTPAPGDWVRANIRTPLPFGPIVRFFGWLKMSYTDDHPQASEIQMMMHSYSTRWFSAIRYQEEGQWWQYRDTSLNWININPPSRPTQPEIWMEIELIVNRHKAEYVSFRAGPSFYDLSGIPMLTTFSPGNHVDLTLKTTTPDPTYVEDVWDEVQITSQIS